MQDSISLPNGLIAKNIIYDYEKNIFTHSY